MTITWPREKQEEDVHQGRDLKQRNLPKGWEADDGLRGWYIFIGKAAA